MCWYRCSFINLLGAEKRMQEEKIEGRRWDCLGEGQMNMTYWKHMGVNKGGGEFCAG